MQRRQFNSGLVALPVFGLGMTTPAWALSEGDAASGVRVAL